MSKVDVGRQRLGDILVLGELQSIVIGDGVDLVSIRSQPLYDAFTDSVYQNKCVNGIFKKLKNNLVAEPVGPVKNGFLFFTSP